MKNFCLTIIMLLIINTIFAQKTLLTGKILEVNTNEPIVGANVSIKGTNRGTITDHTGQYALNVYSQKAVLIIRYKKMRTIEYEVDTQGMIKKVFNFKMNKKFDLGQLFTKKKENYNDSEVLTSNF